MTVGRKRLLGKLLEAVAIASLAIAVTQGIYGDAWGELYLFLGGIVVFFLGRRLGKQPAKEAANMEIN